MRGFDNMKNYVVKVLRYFKDLEEKKDRFVGDEFETTKERYEFLKQNNAVKLVEIVEEQPKEIKEEVKIVVSQKEEAKPKPKKKKASKK